MPLFSRRDPRVVHGAGYRPKVNSTYGEWSLDERLIDGNNYLVFAYTRLTIAQDKLADRSCICATPPCHKPLKDQVLDCRERDQVSQLADPVQTLGELLELAMGLPSEQIDTSCVSCCSRDL
jgi:hypothetical protein